MKEQKTFIKYAVIAAAVCLFLEGVLFQYTALQTRSLQPFDLEISSTPGQTEWTIEPIQLSDVHTVSVTFSGTFDITRVEVKLSDDGHRYVPVSANETLLCPADPATNTRVMRLDVQGYLRMLSLSWDKEGAFLERVRINEPIPYRFRAKRFLLLLCVCLLAIYVRVCRLWDKVFDHQNKKHRMAFAGEALLCALFAGYLFVQLTPYDESLFPWTQQFSYPLAEAAETYELVPHVFVFDSLMQHRPDIGVEVDERLMTAENVYDYSQRDEAVGNYAYWWDYAYLNGKLYVYFGFTPVLLFYFPYYFLTGMLPSYVQCSFFLALLSIAGGFLCFLELAKRYAGNVRLMALLLTAPAVVLGSQVFMLASCPSRYHVSIASAQAFFFFTIWTALRALSASGKRRRIWLFASALCTGLLIWSRPSFAFTCAAFLVVLFLSIVLDKDYARPEKIKDAAAYLVPVLVCAVITCAYNAARFGSPFDFGLTHIFSVWDTHENKLSLRLLPQAIWHYGFDPMSLKTTFPWFRLTDTFVNHTGNYYYIHMAGSAGAFVVPITWGNLLFLRSGSGDNRQKEWRALFFLSMVASAATVWLAFCMAGICERYVCDVLPALCLTGGVCLLRAWGSDAETIEQSVLARRLLTMICVLTYLMAFSRCYANEVNAVMQWAPQRYLSMAELFSLP